MVAVNATAESIELAQKILDTARRATQVDDAIIAGSPDDAVKEWSRSGRQVLAIDPTLVECIRFSGSAEISPEVFRALPYANPIVVFPDPPRLASRDRGIELRMQGFICTGKAGLSYGSTHDPETDEIATFSVLDRTDHDGTKRWEILRTNFSLRGKPMTIDELTESIIDSLAWENRFSADPESLTQFMRSVTKLVTGSLMYLCSTTLDAEPVPRKTVQRGVNAGTIKPFSLTRVGWRIGAALSKRRALEEAGETDRGGRNGHDQGPQHRKAHFRTVWTGSGSKIPKTVFIHPYWTKRDELGDFAVTTVRRVRAS